MNKISLKGVTAERLLDELSNRFSNSVEDALDSELIEELQNRDYSFIDEVTDEKMIDYLESDGWEIKFSGARSKDGLDYLDQTKLDEIVKLFVDSSWIERDVIYNRVRNGRV